MHHGKFKTRFHVHEKVKIQIHADVKWIYTKNHESRKNKILNHASRKKYRGPSYNLNACTSIKNKTCCSLLLAFDSWLTLMLPTKFPFSIFFLFKGPRIFSFSCSNCLTCFDTIKEFTWLRCFWFCLQFWLRSQHVRPYFIECVLLCIYFLVTPTV